MDLISLMRDNQVLEMRMSALQNSVHGLEGVIQRLHAERDALQEEVERLRAESESSPGHLPVTIQTAPDVPPSSGNPFDGVKSIFKSFR